MVMADMTAALLPLLAQLLCTQVTPVLSHARFLEPPSRASMWRMGFEAPVDYQDHEGSCGGLFYQWLANGGRCGICGDRWDDWPRPHERGGRFATGGIVRRYRRGQIISTVVEVTTAHRGYMEFRICELSRERPEATQPCLNRHLLRLADGSGTKYRVGEKSEMARVKLRLPADLTCAHCVIQVSSSDDFDDEFIDLDNNFIDVDGNVVDDSDTSDGFIDSDEPFVDVDDLEEVDLRDLESLGVGDIPTAFDGDNTIDGSSDDPFRSAGLRRGKQLGGLSPSDRECHAVGVWVTVPGMDAWCHTNCLAEPEPSCPEGMCQCGEAGAAPARPSLQLLQGSLPSRPAAALPTPASPSR
ncbi:hypothetical protein FJT64_026749 [Amphibalanus amphitrite]|uniref:Chitin-binding type-4 domain-containing protein n=1 Tax=Amphibalanus amphitrite TaxID=1232801 RepID=A0A6A4W6F9_AMPAM|nr:hypothetical protein FJT64_026749 [Amphibalanus amphitrite]